MTYNECIEIKQQIKTQIKTKDNVLFKLYIVPENPDDMSNYFKDFMDYWEDNNALVFSADSNFLLLWIGYLSSSDLTFDFFDFECDTKL